MLKKLAIMTVLLALFGSCSTVLAAPPYSADQNTRHIEICIDLTQAWYNAFAVGNQQKADSIFKVLDNYNNHFVSDNDAIAVIQKAEH